MENGLEAKVESYKLRDSVSQSLCVAAYVGAATYIFPTLTRKSFEERKQQKENLDLYSPNFAETIGLYLGLCAAIGQGVGYGQLAADHDLWPALIPIGTNVVSGAYEIYNYARSRKNAAADNEVSNKVLKADPEEQKPAQNYDKLNVLIFDPGRRARKDT